MEKDIFNITVSLNFHGYRIDKFLQSQINDLSRTRLQTLIRDGHVKINNTANSIDKANNTPKYVATPFPPLNFNQIGKTCPKKTINAEICN